MTLAAPGQYVVALEHPDDDRRRQVRALLTEAGYRVVPVEAACSIDLQIVASTAPGATWTNVPTLVLVQEDSDLTAADSGIGPSDTVVDSPERDQELVLRAAVLCRRGRLATEALGGALRLDDAHRAATTQAGTVRLSSIEHRLLRALAGRIGEVATRRTLVRAVWPPDARVARNTLDSHVRRLRSKLASIGAPLRIETVHGAGFRLMTRPAS